MARTVRFRFQTKVLVPGFLIMALLVVLPLGLGTRHMATALQAAAAENLHANDAVFQTLQQLRARDLLLRFRSVPNEPRVRAVMKLSDPKTLRFLLGELREELGADALLFANDQGRLLASATANDRFAVDAFYARATASIQDALAGQPNADTVN